MSGQVYFKRTERSGTAGHGVVAAIRACVLRFLSAARLEAPAGGISAGLQTLVSLPYMEIS